jgi:hypothetical protein
MEIDIKGKFPRLYGYARDNGESGKICPCLQQSRRSIG